MYIIYDKLQYYQMLQYSNENVTILLIPEIGGSGEFL